MEGAVSAILTQVATIGESLMSVLTGTLPVALPLIGASLVITKGISLFTRVTNKA